MRVLFLTPQLPYPPQQGAALRNFYMLKGVSDSHRVDLLSFLEPDQSVAQDQIQPLLAQIDRLETIPMPKRPTYKRLINLIFSSLPDMGHRLYSARFEAKLGEMLQATRYDIVQIEGIELARTIPVIRKYGGNVKIVFDAHNAETELQSRISQTDADSNSLKRRLKSLYSRIQTDKLNRFEAWACRSVDRVIAVSTADATLLNRYLPPDRPRIEPIPNCIDIEEWAQPAVAISGPLPRFDLVFTGKMDYRPNVDGMLWFVEMVWPYILKARPETTLAIVGKNPAGEILNLSTKKGVTVTGFVSQIATYVWGAKVIIMPLRMGSGTRLKMVQALAAGKAIVSTTLGAEGFSVISGEHLILADSEEQFAHSIINLLTDKSELARLGQGGHQLVSRYDYRQVTPHLLAIYAAL